MFVIFFRLLNVAMIMIMNIFSPPANFSGDVCSTLFGSTLILTLTKSDVIFSVVFSTLVILFYIIFYNRIFAITFDVLIKPEKYVNKRMKVSGTFHTSFHDGHRYFSVLNWDASGCCPVGFDFIPLSALNFPE